MQGCNARTCNTIHRGMQNATGVGNRIQGFPASFRSRDEKFQMKDQMQWRWHSTVPEMDGSERIMDRKCEVILPTANKKREITQEDLCMKQYSDSAKCNKQSKEKHSFIQIWTKYQCLFHPWKKKSGKYCISGQGIVVFEDTVVLVSLHIHNPKWLRRYNSTAVSIWERNYDELMSWYASMQARA